MIPLYADEWFTFRFADDRVIPRFHLEGVQPGVTVRVYKLNPATGERHDLLAKVATAEGGWVDLPVPLVVRAGGAFAAVQAATTSGTVSATGPIRCVLFDLDGTLVD